MNPFQSFKAQSVMQMSFLLYSEFPSIICVQ